MLVQPQPRPHAKASLWAGWGDYLQKLGISLNGGSNSSSLSKLVQLGPACGTESSRAMLGLTQHAQKVWRMKPFSPEVSRDEWAAGGFPGLGWFWSLEHPFSRWLPVFLVEEMEKPPPLFTRSAWD